ncbi:MAG: type II toxin-antitoxin system VapC family toxin [Actinomycetota bacterium]|nr:type II toxin-antitoxin system VapC family toxin [Actinomycetota bacterium]
MVTYLLDTQVWLWMLAQPERLETSAVALLVDDENRLLLSAASAWEIAIKCRIGRLTLPEPSSRYVPDRMAASGVGGLAIEHSHALMVASLEDHHRDPFDHLLIGQALVEGLPIESADRMLAAYDVEVIDATL